MVAACLCALLVEMLDVPHDPMAADPDGIEAPSRARRVLLLPSPVSDGKGTSRSRLAVRRALLGAVDQAEAMIAAAGTDRSFWHDGIGLFPAGTPLANDEGIKVLGGPRDYPAVRQALARAGYNGETIVVLAPTDAQGNRALSLAGTDQLRRAGMNIDLQEMEMGARSRRLLNQAAPDKGGWNAFFTLLDRSTSRSLTSAAG